MVNCITVRFDGLALIVSLRVESAAGRNGSSAAN